MKARSDLVGAIRDLATALIDTAGAIREFTQAIRGFPQLYNLSNTVGQPKSTPWSDTDVALARRALRPLSDTTSDERTILERMRRRLRKTTPSPEPLK